MWKFVTLLLFLVVAVKADNEYFCTRSCPPFWTAFGRSCYRYFGQPGTWIDAEETCRSFAGTRGLGHLVSIVSDDENSFVTQLVTYSRTIETRDIHEACPAHHQDDAIDEVSNNIPENERAQAGVWPDNENAEDEFSSHDDVPPPETVHSTIQQTLTWIGLNDLKRKGEFTWTDGTKVTFTNWIGQPNIDNLENRDSRDYKGKKYEKSTDDREKRSTDKTTAPPIGNSCAIIVPVSNPVGSQRTWEKQACNDTTVISPFVCRILWI